MGTLNILEIFDNFLKRTVTSVWLVEYMTYMLLIGLATLFGVACILNVTAIAVHGFKS
jgi:hypothetical protein